MRGYGYPRLFAAQAQRAGMFHVKRFSHYELFLIAVGLLG